MRQELTQLTDLVARLEASAEGEIIASSDMLLLDATTFRLTQTIEALRRRSITATARFKAVTAGMYWENGHLVSMNDPTESSTPAASADSDLIINIRTDSPS